MSVNNDPLVTDLFETIRAKAALNTVLTGILGTAPLRMYRQHAPKVASYPLVVMSRVAKNLIGGIGVNYFINLTIYDKSVNASNRDIIERELQGIFDDPNCLTDFSKDNTKIDQVVFVDGGGEFWDDKNKIYIQPVPIMVKARRKIGVV